MTSALLAAYPGPEALKGAVMRAADAGQDCRTLDAFTPFPVEGLPKLMGLQQHGMRTAMLLGGVGAAAAMFGLESYSAVYAYAFNSGGRPLFSWPAFLIAPVELGVLAAALTGFVTLLVKTGLPRLNHPLFDRSAFERASQDQFILAVARPEDPAAAGRARQLLFDAGAVWIEEAEL